MSRHIRDPYRSLKSSEERFRDERSREGFTVISPALAMLAFLCLAYVWIQSNYPPAGRYFGHELIFFVIASGVFNILGIGAIVLAKHKTVGLICNLLVLAWNVAILFLGVVP